MIRLALLTATIGMLSLCTGCYHTYRLENDPLGTPAYSSAERFQRWQRAVDLDWLEMNDDIDNDVLLTGKPSELSIWNLR